jgi:hypothetical protein
VPLISRFRDQGGAVAAASFPIVFLAAFVAYPLRQEIGGSFSGWNQLKPLPLAISSWPRTCTSGAG